MYAYRVRRDCLKRPVLCYTLGRWEFEHSTRHCMEFKITKDKIAQWNKMLLFWIKLSKWTHLAFVSVVHLANFVVFGGSFQVFVVDEVKAGPFAWSKNRSNWNGKFEDFSKPTQKVGQWTILLCVGGKNRAADSNFGEKTASRSRSFETAGSSLDFVYRKLRQIPENPPKTTKLAKWTTETKARWVHLLNFIQKSNILFHCAILSFVILNSIQCLVECSNSQRPNV